MLSAEVFGEEWDEDGRCGAAPCEGIGDEEDPEIVEELKHERRVNCCAGCCILSHDVRF